MWKIRIKARVQKALKTYDEDVLLSLQALISALASSGPNPGLHWKHYGKFKGLKKTEDKRHCHILSGKPTFVCCWRVFKSEKIIEVYYVGTHEKAPY